MIKYMDYNCKYRNTSEMKTSVKFTPVFLTYQFSDKVKLCKMKSIKFFYYFLK